MLGRTRIKTSLFRVQITGVLTTWDLTTRVLTTTIWATRVPSAKISWDISGRRNSEGLHLVQKKTDLQQSDEKFRQNFIFNSFQNGTFWWLKQDQEKEEISSFTFDLLPRVSERKKVLWHPTKILTSRNNPLKFVAKIWAGGAVTKSRNGKRLKVKVRNVSCRKNRLGKQIDINASFLHLIDKWKATIEI